MASLADTIERAGRRLGLQVRPDNRTAFGVKEGYLVQLLRHRSPEWEESVSEIIRHGDTRPLDVVRRALLASPALAAAAIKSKNVDVGDGAVTHKHVRPAFGSLSDESVARTTDALLQAVMETCPPMPETCRLCGDGGAAEPILLNDVVDRVCPSCLDRLRHEAKLARERYASLPLRLPLAMLTGAILALVGAILWAGITIATDTPSAYIGGLIGFLIGWATSRAAGKRGPATQSLVVFSTVLFVLLGEVMINAYRVHRYANAHGFAFDWGAFARAIQDIPWGERGPLMLIFLAAAVGGAYFGKARFAKPRFDIKVDRI